MACLAEQIGWREWLCHSNFSFLLGASHPAQLLDSCLAHKYRSLALCDLDGVYGIARLYRERKKRLLQGRGTPISLRYGAELHLAHDHQLPLVLQDTLVLIACTHAGYSSLCALLSRAHRHGKQHPLLPLADILTTAPTGLAAIQPMRGLLRQREHNPAQLDERCAALRDHFQGRFYLAVSRHRNPAEDYCIPPTLARAKRLGLPLLCCQDIFFHNREQKKVSDLLHALRHNCNLEQAAPQLFVNSMRHPLSLPRLEQLYAHLPGYRSALEAAAELDAQCAFDLDQLRYCYPREFIPEGHSAQSWLEQLTWEHAVRRYGSEPPQKVTDLLRHELALVEQLDFADYFLTVYDIVCWARSQEILCQGRGSAANSAICYVLGITAVDPGRFDLLFERFISVERGEPPDIDVDFEHERREEVIQYIYRRYGRTRAAMVCNVICFKTRGALRAVGKALGVGEELLQQVSRTLSSRALRGLAPPQILEEVRENSNGDGLRQDLPQYIWRYWGELATALRGFPRHLGIHSGGFIVSHQPLDQLCPREPATMPGRSVITWCKEDIEGLGFFKIDILALGGLTLIRKCLALLRRHYNRDLNLAGIPAADAATYRMIRRGDTVGTFQIESRAQIAFLPRHQPMNFYDLVVQLAIIRPGPIQGGMIHPYLRRRAGEEMVSFPDPRLEPILRRTYGVPIFQEQVMRIAIAVGGFSGGEADELRKSIGSFSLRGDPEILITRLGKGLRANGIKEEFVADILNHIQGFASYGFPESHAASFALLAYATAYLKCHYPAAFFAALLNSQPMGFYGTDTLLRTARSCGVSLLPVSVRYSDWDHSLEQCGAAGAAPRWGIRLGLRLVAGLSQSAMERMLARRREQGAWPDMQAFLQANPISRTDATALAAADALACYGFGRRDALWLAEAVPWCRWLRESEDEVLLPQESPLEKVQLDFQATSTSLGLHPTLLIKRHAWEYPIPRRRLMTAQQVGDPGQNGNSVTVFGMVSCRQAPPTAKGVCFVTVWDESGSLNLILYPGVYKRFRKLVDSQAFLCVSGKVQATKDIITIVVQKVYAPTEQGSHPLYSGHDWLKATHNYY